SRVCASASELAAHSAAANNSLVFIAPPLESLTRRSLPGFPLLRGQLTLSAGGFMRPARSLALSLVIIGFAGLSVAADTPAVKYKRELAAKLGGDEQGMRQYVMVILKTGPTPKPKGKERDEMFKGHFANIERLASEGKLVLAGPFDGVDGWRGMFV